MAIRKLKPVTPTQRFRTVADFSEITRTEPEKSLLEPLFKKGGRNNRGRITVRHRGGGHKRRYRKIDFKRNKHEVPAKVFSIEYDPNRSARICLLHYIDGEKRYILWPKGVQVGDPIFAGPEAPFNPGNALPLDKIPLGTLVHNIELNIGKGGQMARSAGSFAQVMAKEGDYVTLRLPSGEVRMVHSRCYATIGEVGNAEHENIVSGKAGRSRWLGRRPKVRGVAMNPVDHPHGGGEGRTSGGRHPVSPWGMPTKGFKTRKGRGLEQQEREACRQDLVATLDDRSGVPGSHNRRAQRTAVRARVHSGKHGGPQAWRVRSYADLPRPHQQEVVTGGCTDGGTFRLPFRPGFTPQGQDRS